MTTWLVRLNFIPGQRPTGTAVVEDNVAHLRELPGVLHLDFHLDMNDECALWAIWRLNSYEDMLNIYSEAVFASFAASLKPMLVPRGVDNSYCPSCRATLNRCRSRAPGSAPPRRLS